MLAGYYIRNGIKAQELLRILLHNSPKKRRSRRRAFRNRPAVRRSGPVRRAGHRRVARRSASRPRRPVCLPPCSPRAVRHPRRWRGGFGAPGSGRRAVRTREHRRALQDLAGATHREAHGQLDHRPGEPAEDQNDPRIAPLVARYTRGTKLRREGFGAEEIASALDQNDMQQVAVYTENTVQEAEIINRLIGPKLAPFGAGVRPEFGGSGACGPRRWPIAGSSGERFPLPGRRSQRRSGLRTRRRRLPRPSLIGTCRTCRRQIDAVLPISREVSRKSRFWSPRFGPTLARLPLRWMMNSSTPSCSGADARSASRCFRRRPC